MSGNIAFVADLHIGKYSNNEKWHDTAIEWASWLATSLKRNKIRNVVICGDVFDNRSEIGVNTIHTANVIFKALSEFKIYIIIGNHDAYYKNNVDVNSICVFDEWPNIEVFNEPAARYVDGTHIQFVPYDCIPLDVDTDILCGHFDINGFRMNRNKVCDGKINPMSLLEHAPLVISGHFHMKDMKTYATGDVLYCGSPYQLDWSECDNTPVYTIYDSILNNVTFVPNTKSPKFIKITDETQIQESVISGNIIRFILSETKSQDELIDIRSNISKMRPFSFEVIPHIDVSVNITQTDEQHTIGDKIDILDEIEKTLANMDIADDISKLVLDRMTELYYNNIKRA